MDVFVQIGSLGPNNHIMAKSHMHSTFSQNRSTGSSEFLDVCLVIFQNVSGSGFFGTNRIFGAQITIFWQNHTCTAHLAKILEVRILCYTKACMPESIQSKLGGYATKL